MEVDENSVENDDITMTELSYSGLKELTEYFVKNYTFIKLNVDVLLGRRLFSLILIVSPPTVILLFVGHLLNCFKEFFIEATISVNVTLMLVLTMMFISMSNNLPKTSFIKMIDVD